MKTLNPITSDLKYFTPSVGCSYLLDEKVQTMRVYASENGNDWVIEQIARMFKAVVLDQINIPTKMSAKQVVNVADDLARLYPYLKLQDIDLFFRNISNGHYGTFKGSVDKMVVFTMLRDFLKWRTDKIKQIQSASPMEGPEPMSDEMRAKIKAKLQEVAKSFATSKTAAKASEKSKPRAAGQIRVPDPETGKDLAQEYFRTERQWLLQNNPDNRNEFEKLYPFSEFCNMGQVDRDGICL